MKASINISVIKNELNVTINKMNVNINKLDVKVNFPFPKTLNKLDNR